MSTAKSTGLPRNTRPAEIEQVIWNVENQGTVRQQEEVGKEASTLVSRSSLSSTRELDRLIDDLTDLRKKLENRSSRIQSDIVEYASLSQSAAQLTKIVSDSVAQIEKTVPLTPEDAHGRNFVGTTSPRSITGIAGLK